MGILSNLLGRGITNALNHAFYGWAQNGSVSYMEANAEKYVTDGYGNEIVYAIMQVLVNKQTEAPLLVSKIIDEKSYSKFKSFIRDAGDPYARVVTVQHRNKAFEDIESGGYGTDYALLKNPNDYQTSAEFWGVFWLMYNLTGEAFIYVTLKEGTNKPIEMHVLPSQNVTIVYSGNYKDPIRGYSFNTGKNDVEIPYRQVMHLKKPNPNWNTTGTQLRGYSPLASGRKTVTKNNLNIEAQATAMKNGGSVTLLSGDPSKAKMTPTQMNQMDELIKEKIKGADNNKNIIMTNGYLTSQKVGDTLVDMDLINAEKRDEQRLCSLWGVHPILIGSDVNSTENNVRAAYKSLVTNVVLSDLLKRDEKLTAFLNSFYNLNHVIRTDTTVYSELAPDLELMVKVFGQPRLTENQKLAIFNYGESSDPNMNKTYMPTGWVPLDQLNANALDNDDYV